MMREVAESEARGALLPIYADLRELCRVPYVSSLQRHVATMPGCLEYAWAICRPGFTSGRIQRTAWSRAARVPIEPFPPLSRAALSLLGVDGTDLDAIRNVCASFVRVAPINLLFAGIIERLLAGEQPGEDIEPESGDDLPAMLPRMPAMLPMSEHDEGTRAVLMQLATEIGGEPFVPGLYRLLAPWPGYLAHIATLITPLLSDDEARAERAQIALDIVAAADTVLPHLASAPATLPPPDSMQRNAIVSAILTYRQTSPEMIVFGSLLLDALPDGASA